MHGNHAAPRDEHGRSRPRAGADPAQCSAGFAVCWSALAIDETGARDAAPWSPNGRRLRGRTAAGDDDGDAAPRPTLRTRAAAAYNERTAAPAAARIPP
jgi:hypothetical protein